MIRSFKSCVLLMLVGFTPALSQEAPTPKVEYQSAFETKKINWGSQYHLKPTFAEMDGKPTLLVKGEKKITDPRWYGGPSVVNDPTKKYTVRFDVNFIKQTHLPIVYIGLNGETGYLGNFWFRADFHGRSGEWEHFSQSFVIPTNVTRFSLALMEFPPRRLTKGQQESEYVEVALQNVQITSVPAGAEGNRAPYDMMDRNRAYQDSKEDSSIGKIWANQYVYAPESIKPFRTSLVGETSFTVTSPENTTPVFKGELKKVSDGLSAVGRFDGLTKAGIYVVRVGQESSEPFKISKGMYDGLIDVFLEFIEAQSSGKVVPNYRDAIHLDDALYKDPKTKELVHMDLVGGFYDAGDLRKYPSSNLRVAKSMFFLMQNPKTLVSAKSKKRAKVNYDHAMAWLMKVVDEKDGRLYGRVGNTHGQENWYTDNVKESWDDRLVDPPIPMTFARMGAFFWSQYSYYKSKDPALAAELKTKALFIRKHLVPMDIDPDSKDVWILAHALMLGVEEYRATQSAEAKALLLQAGTKMLGMQILDEQLPFRGLFLRSVGTEGPHWGWPGYMIAVDTLLGLNSLSDELCADPEVLKLREDGKKALLALKAAVLRLKREHIKDRNFSFINQIAYRYWVDPKNTELTAKYGGYRMGETNTWYRLYNEKFGRFYYNSFYVEPMAHVMLADQDKALRDEILYPELYALLGVNKFNRSFVSGIGTRKLIPYNMFINSPPNGAVLPGPNRGKDEKGFFPFTVIAARYRETGLSEACHWAQVVAALKLIDQGAAPKKH